MSQSLVFKSVYCHMRGEVKRQRCGVCPCLPLTLGMKLSWSGLRGKPPPHIAALPPSSFMTYTHFVFPKTEGTLAGLSIANMTLAGLASLPHPLSLAKNCLITFLKLATTVCSLI